MTTKMEHETETEGKGFTSDDAHETQFDCEISKQSTKTLTSIVCSKEPLLWAVMEYMRTQKDEYDSQNTSQDFHLFHPTGVVTTTDLMQTCSQSPSAHEIAHVWVCPALWKDLASYYKVQCLKFEKVVTGFSQIVLDTNLYDPDAIGWFKHSYKEILIENMNSGATTSWKRIDNFKRYCVHRTNCRQGFFVDTVTEGSDRYVLLDDTNRQTFHIWCYPHFKTWHVYQFLNERNISFIINKDTCLLGLPEQTTEAEGSTEHRDGRREQEESLGGENRTQEVQESSKQVTRTQEAGGITARTALRHITEISKHEKVHAIKLTPPLQLDTRTVESLQSYLEKLETSTTELQSSLTGIQNEIEVAKDNVQSAFDALSERMKSEKEMLFRSLMAELEGKVTEF